MSTKNDTDGKIQLLPEHIIDQIKAGEVIERPSTLLKELLENSIDAGANQVEIEIVSNGLDLLSVRDNGKGIPFPELDLAFCRHATSKIERFEDIYQLFTYGFRGEALASIAAVSKLTCVSNPKGQPEGLIKINGGEVVALDLDKSPEEGSGTKMYIRDLFYNTPARMKFIQSKTSEKNQLDKIVKAFLLTQPSVRFSIKWDDQDKKVYKAQDEDDADGLKKRVEAAIKKNRPLNLVELSSSYDDIHFKVFLSRESSRGNAGKAQYIFVNDRLVQDVQIHKVILNSAQRLWPIGESGSYCAYIEVPAERVDVNIHPNKTQVKFYEAGKVLSLASAAIKDGLSRQTSMPNFSAESSQQSNMEMESIAGRNEMRPGMKEVEYRHFDFNSGAGESSLRDYFHRLDHGQQKSRAAGFNFNGEEEKIQTLAHFGESALYKIENKIYGVKARELMALWLGELLTKGDKTPTPLLVSQPLELEKNLSDAQMGELESLGFEVDKIGATDFVLRSFPNCLKSFPFREYLQSYINNGLKDLAAVDLPIDQSDYHHHHKKAIESIGITSLLEKGLATEVTGEKLKKLL